jgi:hypothetical protein
VAKQSSTSVTLSIAHKIYKNILKWLKEKILLKAHIISGFIKRSFWVTGGFLFRVKIASLLELMKMVTEIFLH